MIAIKFNRDTSGRRLADGAVSAGGYGRGLDDSGTCPG
jgi:hypothetical protein